jgi:PAS domain S-box-containing protein
MNELVSTGILLTVIGALIVAGVLISARINSRRQQLFGKEDDLTPVNLGSANNGVLVANVGGQVTYANETARRWFELQNEEPDLWLLAQRVEPSDAFLELFAMEGQATFSIRQLKIEATSHKVAVGERSQFIVVMSEEEPLPVLDREERGSPKALQLLSEITQAMSSSLDLAETMQATLDGTQRLINFDSAQICLWDQSSEILRPMRRVGPKAFVDATRKETEVYHRGEGYGGWIVSKRQSLIIPDAPTYDDPPLLERETSPAIGSVLAAPLYVRNRFIGTLELYTEETGRFDRTDQAILSLIAEQAAIAIENARQYSSQAIRVTELSGLQKIAGAISALEDPRQLYAQLGIRVAELMETEIAGVLIHGRDQELLIAQRPFYGMVDAVASQFAISLRKGSPARSLWETVSYWFSNNVNDDHLIKELNLAELVEMAGIKTMALASMTVGDERNGVLMVSNKANGTAFSMEDIRLLQTYADQAAILVASAQLYGQEQSRVAELTGLQQIAQTMSAFTNPEELYDQLTERIAELLEVEVCGILLHEPEDNILIARKPFYGVDDEIAAQYMLNVGKRGLARDVWREHDYFVSNSVFTDEKIDMLGIREIARQVNLRTIMLAPLSAGGRRFGLLQVSNKTDGSDFADDDQRLISIFAGQAAALIDNARLYQDTDETLRKRAAELRSVSRVSRELNATLELERILEVIAVEAQRAEGATWANIVVFDFYEKGEISKPLTSYGSQLGEEARILELAAARSGETLLIEDFGKVSHYPRPIEGAQSALLVPILFEGRSVGVIGLYSDKPRGLKQSAAEFAQALSSQATIAVTNATRHMEQVERSDQLSRRAEQMTQIFELGRAFRGDQSIEGNLTSVTRAIVETAGFNIALVGVLDEAHENLHYVAYSGLSISDANKLETHTVDWQQVAHFFNETHQTSNSFFVPFSDGKDLAKELGLPPRTADMPGDLIKTGRWYYGDVLMVPLHSSSDIEIGVLVIDQPRNNQKPSPEAIELLEIFGNQASMIVENSRLYRSVEERAEELASSLKNLEKSYQELDKLSQEMIRKDVELSQANELLNVRAQRLLALHRIMESVDTTRSPEDVLADIAVSVVEEMDIDQCLLALGNGQESDLRIVAAEGRLPIELKARQVLLGSKHVVEKIIGTDLLVEVYETQEPVVYARGGDRRTRAAKLAQTLNTQTYVALPLQVDTVGGVLLVGSTRAGAAFSDDDRDMFTLLASQIVVEYENARLYQAVQSEAALAASDRDRLQQLHLITTALQQTRVLQDRLAIIARGIRSVGWEKVAVSLLNEEQENAILATAGYSEAEEQALHDQLLPGDFWTRRFDDPDFSALRLGSCYFLPHENQWVVDNIDTVTAADVDPNADPNAWHPKDQIYLPMYAGNDIIGVINLRSPANGERPTLASLRPIELFVQQAASALENTRLYQETLELQSYTEAVVESIQQGIIVTDAEGVVETLNSFVRDQYGWSEDLVGQNLFESQPMLRDFELQGDLKAVIENGSPVERTGIQYPVADAVRTLNIYLYPRLDEQNAVTGVVILLEDITQRAMLEADIALRGQQLAALNEVSRKITGELDIEHVIETALDQANEVIDYDHLELWLLVEDTGMAELIGARSTGPIDENKGLKVKLKQVPQFRTISKDGRPLLLDDRSEGDINDTGYRITHGHLRSWLGVPMVSGGVMAGIMVFEKTEAHAYAPADSQVAAAYANQVAVALQNARLFEEAEDRAATLHSRSERLALLNRISSTLGTSLDRNSILQTTVDELVKAIDADQGSVYLFDEDQAVGALSIQSPSNPDGSVDSITIQLEDNPVVSYLLENKAPLTVPDIEQDERLDSMKEALVQRGAKSAIIVPLIIGNALTGLIAIEETETRREFEPEQIELMQTITNQAAISVQNAHLFQETVARQRELSILFEAGRIAASSLALDTVTGNAAEYFTRSLNADGCAIALFNTENSALNTLVEFDRSKKKGEQQELPGYRFELDAFPNIAKALAEQRVIVLETDCPDLSVAEAEWLNKRETAGLLILPLAVRDESIGMAELWYTREGHQFAQRDLRLANALGSSVATAMENARLHDETEQRLDELSQINELSRAITQIISIEDLYQMLIRQVEKLFGANSLTIARREKHSEKITFPLAVRNGLRIGLEPVDANSDLYSYVLNSGEPLLISERVEEKVAELGLKHTEEGLQSFLSIPLISGEMHGVMAIEDYEGRVAFSETNLRVLNPIAAQVAVSIENARLYSELEQRLSETTTLQEVSRVVNSALDLQEIFERVVGELANAFKYPLIGLYTVEENGLLIQAHHGFNKEEAARIKHLSLDAGIVGRAILQGKPQLVLNAKDDPDYLEIKDWVHCEIAVPIISDEEVLGVLSVSSGEDNPLDENDLALMKTFAGQVAAAMTNARLYAQMVQLSEELEQRVEERTAELREERDRIDTLYKIAVELTTSLDLDMVLNRALELVGEAVGADTGTLFLVDPQSDMLIHRASMEYDATLPPGGRRVELHRHEGLAGWVMDNQQSLVIDNVQVDPRWANIPGTEERRALLGAPLVATGDVLGCIFFNSNTEGAFSEDHLTLVEAAARQVANAINNAELYRLIRDQAERLGVMLRSQQTEAAKSQAILESVADGVMVSDQAGEIILFNAAAERTLGLRRDQVLGRPSGELTGLYGSGAETWDERFAIWQASPREYAGEFLSEQIEFEDRVVQVHVSPVLHGSEYLGLVSVFRDITREVMADRIKSEFVARVSHELRTPMTSIKGYADLLLLGAAGEVTPEQRRFLETVKSNADRLSLLVNDLLDISRIEQGQFELDIQPVQVNELIEDILTAFEGRKAEDGRTIELIAEIPEDIEPIEADYDRLMQIMTNLVSNAYQYTPDDGSVTISIKPGSDGIQVDIVDTGIGIPDEAKERVFERFFRGESQPLVFKHAGTGLGLSIVQQIIEMHSGRVWFESQEGEGSTFSIWLPYKFEETDMFTAGSPA